MKAAACALACAGGLAAPAVAAAPAQTFELGYAGGCRTWHPTRSSTAVGNCLDRGTAAGPLGTGTATLRWTRVYVAHSSASNPNTESGSLVLGTPEGRASFSLKGVQAEEGVRSSGTWTLARASGKLAGRVARSGLYTAVWPRRGSRISLRLAGPGR